MYRHWHHHWQSDCSFCRHRTHNTCDGTSKSQWQRVPGSLLCGVMGGGAQRMHTSAPSDPEKRVTRRESPSAVDTVSSTRNHLDPKSGTCRGPASASAHMASSAATKTGGAAPDPSCGAAICGFACDSAFPTDTAAPSQEAGTNPRRSKKNETKAPGRAATSGDDPPSRLSRPSQSLYSTALRETPLFVKHESIQTSPSKAKTRSAFAVIRTDGESTGRSPAREGDIKGIGSAEQPTDTRTSPAQDENIADGHHHHCHYHHHGVCWAYHHCRQTCGHAWAQSSHHQQETKQEKKDSDTTCAGFFINVPKDDWGVLLKEAWKRIKTMIRRSGNTILLDRVPSALLGERAEHDVTIGESVRWYDAHCGHERSRECCSCAYSAPNERCLHSHKCCRHREDDPNYFYQRTQPNLYFDEGPDEFYDCFECQVSSSHQY